MKGTSISTQNPSPKTSFRESIVSFLLWNDSIPQWLDMIIKVFSELQIIALLGYYTFNHFSTAIPSATEQLLISIHKYMTLDFDYNFWKDDPFTNAAVVAAMGYTLAIILLFAYSVFVHVSNSKKKDLIMKVWSYFGALHHNIMFLGVQQFAFSLGRHFSQGKPTYLMSIQSEAFVITLVVVTIVINFAFGLVISRFMYSPMQDDNTLASRTYKFSLIGLLFKFTHTALSTMVKKEDTRIWLGLTNALILISFRLYKYMNELPFYNSGPLYIFLTFAAIQESQAVLNFFWSMVNETRGITSFMVFYTQIIFAIFFWKLCHSQVIKIIFNFSSKHKKRQKPVNSFFEELFALNQIFFKGSVHSHISNGHRKNSYEILFLQLISSHTKTCLNSNCICKIIILDKTIELGELVYLKAMPNRERFYFEYIKDFYQQGVQETSLNSLLKLQLAALLVEHDESACLSAIQLINSVNTSSNRLEVRILAKKLIEKVEVKMQGAFFNENIGLKVKKLIEYKLAKTNLAASIAKNTQIFNTFWEAYKANKPNIKKLLDLNKQANINAEQVNKLWEALNRDFSYICYKDYIVYGLFLRLIRNAPYTSDKTLLKYFAMVEQRLNAHTNQAENQDLFFDEEKIVVIVSLSPETFGSISYVSQSVENIGYITKDLLGKNFGLLMSPFFGRRSQKYLQGQILAGMASLLDKSFPVFIRLKSGYVRSATLHIAPYPYLDQGFYCLGVIELTKEKEECLFLLPDGRIEAVSKDIGDDLSIDPLRTLSCLVDNICLDSSKIYKYMSSARSSPRTSIALTLRNNKKNSTATNFAAATEHELLFSSPRRTSQPLMSSSRSPVYSPLSKIGTLFKYTYEDQMATEELQDVNEDFTKGVKLKFTPNIDQGIVNNQSAPVATYNTIISKLSYENEDIYILRLQKLWADKDYRNDTTTLVRDEKVNLRMRTNIYGIKEEPPEIEAGIHTDKEIFGSITFKNNPLDQKRSTPDGDILNSKSVISSKDILPNRSTKFQTLKIDPIVYKHPTKGENANGRATQVKDEVKKYITERRQHLLNGVDLSYEMDESSTRTGGRGLNTLARFEKGIYFQNKITYYKLVKISIVLLILATIILFIYYKIQGEQNFQHIIVNVTILKLTIERLFEVFEMNRRTSIIKVIENGFMTRQRNGVANFTVSLLGDFMGLSTVLAAKNNELRDVLYMFNLQQQQKFNELVKVNWNNQVSELIGSESAFQLCSELTSSGFHLYTLRTQSISPDDPDLRFIFNNTLNGIVIHSESLYDLLIEKDREIIQGMKNLIIYIQVICAAVTIAVIMVLVHSEYVFYNKKMLFFEQFLRISDQEAEQILVRSHEFFDMLNDIGLNEDEMMERMRKIEITQTVPETDKPRAKQAKNLSHSKKKEGDYSSINRDVWPGILSMVLYIVFFSLAYAIFYIFFISNEALVQVSKQRIIETNLVLSRLSEAVATLYTYIGHADLTETYVRNTPLVTEWERNYAILQRSNGFFTNLRSESFGNETSAIMAVISGDICVLIGQRNSGCYGDGKGSKLQGLIGVNNYVLNSLRNIKDSYDMSDKTNQAKEMIYNTPEFSEVERMYYTNTIPGHQILQQIFLRRFLKIMEDFKEKTYTINIIFVVIFAILGRLYWVTVLKRMEEEKVHFQRIMTVIPISVILQNQFLKNLLEKNCKRMLMSG